MFKLTFSLPLQVWLRSTREMRACAGVWSLPGPDSLKGGGPGNFFDNVPRESANFTPFLKKRFQFKKKKNCSKSWGS